MNEDLTTKILVQAADIKQKMSECYRAIGEANNAGCEWGSLEMVVVSQIQMTADFLASTWRVLDHIQNVARATVSLKSVNLE